MESLNNKKDVKQSKVLAREEKMKRNEEKKKVREEKIMKNEEKKQLRLARLAKKGIKPKNQNVEQPIVVGDTQVEEQHNPGSLANVTPVVENNIEQAINQINEIKLEEVVSAKKEKEMKLPMNKIKGIKERNDQNHIRRLVREVLNECKNGTSLSIEQLQNKVIEKQKKKIQSFFENDFKQNIPKQISFKLNPDSKFEIVR